MLNFPIPYLSKKNVKFIENIILKERINLIIEYGSGTSTLYFIEKFKDEKISFTSVENSKSWFYKNIKYLSIKNKIISSDLRIKYWGEDEYLNFFKSPNKPYTPIIKGKIRLEKWERVMKLGPFFRFESDSGSRLSGKLTKFKKIFFVINNFLRILPYFRYERTTWFCKLNRIKFNYELVSPGMKDQFGVSPNRYEYFYAGIKNIKDETSNILIIIDGGPRHYIVDKLIENLKNMNLHICLLDASRPEYEKILSKYRGNFHSGESKFLDGSDFYSEKYPDEEKRNYILSRELWYYRTKKLT